MPRSERFSERIGAVFLPEADVIEVDEGPIPSPEGWSPGESRFPLPTPGLPFRRPLTWPAPPPGYKLCPRPLKQGCYTISFTPSGTPILGTRYRGTLRAELTSPGVRISGDLYTYRLLDDIILGPPGRLLAGLEPAKAALPSDEAADTGGMIPIYPRRYYYSYLEGTRAPPFFWFVAESDECFFTLEFDEFVYNHPSTGFSGSFNTEPTRSIRFVLRWTATPDVYSGDAYAGAAKIGTVSIRWISDYYRRAHLQLNTLQGAVAPPAAVDGQTMTTMFADVGWDLTFADGGTISLPGALSNVNPNGCWDPADLHTLMSSVPGYNPAELDSVWRVHLIAAPAQLDYPKYCPSRRGRMFDSSFGSDPNAVPREGTATFSHDGYPADEVLDGKGGSHYDDAKDQQQLNVPRAYLRSATHEVGHAFNQIHQEFEGGPDNSIMTGTDGVARVLGIWRTFPDDIDLCFNARVTKHLRHLPDPAVRPGAMNFFGFAIAAPEAADVAWLDPMELLLDVSSERVALGEPVTLSFQLTNRGKVPIPAPAEPDVESATVRVSVTDRSGRITFMRPPEIHSCPRITIVELPPNASVTGTTTLFWGLDGFAFETPGRHTVEVILLWDLAGVPVAASGERDVFVSYPISNEENEVAALMLDPEVGAAVAVGDLSRFERAGERVKQAVAVSPTHPACQALRRLELLERNGGQGESTTRR
jgi:hypothetical protein